MRWRSPARDLPCGSCRASAVKKGKQNLPVHATTPAIPEHVSVAMAEIAENMQKGLLALAVGAGLQFDADLDGGRRDGVGRAKGPS